MLKGPRFIWWYWIKQAQVSVKVHQDKVVMKANTLSYLYLHKPLLLSRTITFYKETMQWEIEDECEASSTSFVFQQVWHVAVNAKQHLKFMAQAHHQELQPSIEVGYYASYYGLKENCEDVIFKSTSTLIKTSITYQA
jgi:predicted enzyme related to lactoylglutathione lyase